MAIENINDLESAEIRLNSNGELEDLFVAIFKNNTMNFTRFENLPIYTKYQVDNKVSAFEKDMTLKMQERSIINKIYIKSDENSNVSTSNNANGFQELRGTPNLVEHYLKIDQIADKLNKFAYKEIGVRYNISTTTGKHTESSGRNVIRQGNTTLIAGPDLEPSMLKPAFSKLDEQGNEITQENIFAREYHPWKDMKKVQISMDSSSYNYDMSIDNGGNYFTEVPLYYVDQRFIIEESYTVTGYDGNTYVKYRPLIDITGIWNAANPLSCIPKEYQTSNYSIGMYKWVCEYPLYGYRPASFFVKKINVVPEEDTGNHDPSLPRYVKTEIGGIEYYMLYKNYLEGNLLTDEIPVLYCMVEGNGEYNTKILTTKHYFSCYETSLEIVDNTEYAVSKPGKYQSTSASIGTFRDRVTNLGAEYSLIDMRGVTDFFGHLIDIEYSTLDSQKVCAGFTGGIYTKDSNIPLTQSNEGGDNFICNYRSVIYLYPNQIISVGTDLDSINRMNKAIYKYSRTLQLDVDFTLDMNTVYYRSNLVDGVPTYSTSYDDAIDSYEYYLGTIDGVGEIYAAKITTESELPSINNDISRLHQIYYNIENHCLYTPPMPSNSPKSHGILYRVYIDGTITENFKEGNVLYNNAWKTGSTDILSDRTGSICTDLSSDGDDKYHAFKWNWIENPYGNLYKFIDGIHISINETDGFDDPHSTIWYCDTPELYNSNTSNTNYTKLLSYICPEGKSTDRVNQLGFDPVIPWIQLPNSVGNNIYNNGYGLYPPEDVTSKKVYTIRWGGTWSTFSFSGLRLFSRYELSLQHAHTTTYIQKVGD